MVQRVFLFNRLREGVAPEEFEHYVREQDYPVGRSLPGVTRFEVVRLVDTWPQGGKPPYDFVEVVEITSLEAYRAIVAEPVLAELTKHWERYIGESVTVLGEVVEG